MKKEKKPSCWKRLLSFSGGYKKLIVLGCTLSGFASAVGLLPYIFIYFTARDALASYPMFSNVEQLAKWGWYALYAALLNVVLYFAALMCTHIAAFRTARNMRKAALCHAIALPMGFFSKNMSGRLRKIIDDNAGLTEDLIAHKFPDLTGAVVTPIVSIFVLFVFDPIMGAICLFTMAASIAAMAGMMSGKNAGFFHRYQREIEKMSAEAVEYVRGIPVVKTFQQTIWSFKAFYRAIMSYSDLAGKYAMSCRTGQTIFLVCINGAFFLLIPAALFLAAGGNGWQVIANFIFYSIFAPACGASINRVMYASESVMKANEAVFRLDEIFSEPLMEFGKKDRMDAYGIEFDNVVFSYSEDAPAAVDGVSFSIEQGTTVALIGPSGGGKTTVASLVPRFFDIKKGEIRIGGDDVRSYTEECLMKNISFVFQDPCLFKKSIFDNIRSAKPDASRAEVMEAAKKAQALEFINTLPRGLDTVIGTKGTYLSGGQKQRIAIARAILKDAPIVILDEATAFTDPENEYLIQKAFTNLMKGKTVLMIAHRLSSVEDADKIIVISEGRKIEEGTASELLEKNGAYKRMRDEYEASASWKIKKEEK